MSGIICSILYADKLHLSTREIVILNIYDN